MSPAIVFSSTMRRRIVFAGNCYSVLLSDQNNNGINLRHSSSDWFCLPVQIHLLFLPKAIFWVCPRLLHNLFSSPAIPHKVYWYRYHLPIKGEVKVSLQERKGSHSARCCIAIVLFIEPIQFVPWIRWGITFLSSNRHQCHRLHIPCICKLDRW